MESNKEKKIYNFNNGELNEYIRKKNSKLEEAKELLNDREKGRLISELRRTFQGKNGNKECVNWMDCWSRIIFSENERFADNENEEHYWKLGVTDGKGNKWEYTYSWGSSGGRKYEEADLIFSIRHETISWETYKPNSLEKIDNTDYAERTMIAIGLGTVKIHNFIDAINFTLSFISNKKNVRDPLKMFVKCTCISCTPF